MTTEPPSSERRFIQRLQQRDERAFNELVEAYGLRVFRLGLAMLGRKDEAEDLVQDVFVQIFKGIDTFREESQLGTWIYRVAVNTCKNRAKYLARRPRTLPHLTAEQLPDGAADGGLSATSASVPRPDQVAMGHQAELILQECIAELEDDFREVLILRDLEDLSYEEICEITRLPEGTVKSRLHRARNLLKTKVNERLGSKL